MWQEFAGVFASRACRVTTLRFSPSPVKSIQQLPSVSLCNTNKIFFQLIDQIYLHYDRSIFVGDWALQTRLRCRKIAIIFIEEDAHLTTVRLLTTGSEFYCRNECHLPILHPTGPGFFVSREINHDSTTPSIKWEVIYAAKPSSDCLLATRNSLFEVNLYQHADSTHA